MAADRNPPGPCSPWLIGAVRAASQPEAQLCVRADRGDRPRCFLMFFRPAAAQRVVRFRFSRRTETVSLSPSACGLATPPSRPVRSFPENPNLRARQLPLRAERGWLSSGHAPNSRPKAKDASHHAPRYAAFPGKRVLLGTLAAIVRRARGASGVGNLAKSNYAFERTAGTGYSVS